MYQHSPEGALTKEQQCLQAFKTSSYENHKERNPRRVPGTCHWVLDNQLFRDWRDSPQNALLWISADPGCGKSVLAKALIDEALLSDGSSTVCYFFFKDNEEQDDLATALSALSHQSFSQRRDLLRHALQARGRNGPALKRESREMWRILKTSAAYPNAQPVICVLDALDECKDTDRRHLIELLCDLQASTRHTPCAGSLKVIVTSRPYDNVQRWSERTTSTWPHICLRGEDENDENHKGINLAIEQRIQELAQEFDLGLGECESLRQRLTQMQHRTYLWLHLAMEEVPEVCQDNIYAEKLRIVSLPSSVEDAYERLLRRTQDRHGSLAERVLLIIVGARRPLSVEEMALALSAR